ncbi:MAG: hypothetical protein WCA06_16205, partial [Terrimicrobiaceae bacterium]
TYAASDLINSHLSAKLPSVNCLEETPIFRVAILTANDARKMTDTAPLVRFFRCPERVRMELHKNTAGC